MLILFPGLRKLPGTGLTTTSGPQRDFHQSYLLPMRGDCELPATQGRTAGQAQGHNAVLLGASHPRGGVKATSARHLPSDHGIGSTEEAVVIAGWDRQSHDSQNTKPVIGIVCCFTAWQNPLVRAASLSLLPVSGLCSNCFVVCSVVLNSLWV